MDYSPSPAADCNAIDSPLTSSIWLLGEVFFTMFFGLARRKGDTVLRVYVAIKTVAEIQQRRAAPLICSGSKK
jgi:hypothetical protein